MATGSNSVAYMSCGSLLSTEQVTKIDINFDKSVQPRSPKQILLRGQNQAVIKNYEDSIVPNSKGMQPHVRRQCFGTCYLYASKVILENQLKQQGSLPLESFVLSGPFIGAISDLRIPSYTTVISPRELLHGGDSEALHTLNDKPLYYLSPESINAIGSTHNALKLEEDFLKVFVEQQTFRYLGKTFTDHLYDPDSRIESTMVKAFQKYIQVVGKEDVSIESLTVKSIDYTRALIPWGDAESYVTGYISTAFESTQKDVNREIIRALKEQSPLPDSAFKKINGAFADFAIPLIVSSLQKGRFVKISLNAKLFGETHSVTLTNLVVDKRTKKLIGFKYLNSHGDGFGVKGYGFLHAIEVAKYIFAIDIIRSVNIKKKPLRLSSF